MVNLRCLKAEHVDLLLHVLLPFQQPWPTMIHALWSGSCLFPCTIATSHRPTPLSSGGERLFFGIIF